MLRLRFVALLVVAGSLLSCSAATGGGRPRDGGDASGTGSGRPSGDVVVVASFNFPESGLVAEIYAQALEAAGVPVRRELGLGPRELVQPALQQGFVDVVPEYAGTAMASVGGGTPPAVTDVDAVLDDLERRLRPWDVHVLAAASAANQNALVVTRATAGRLRLETTSDLVDLAPRLVIGGPPECPSRLYCLPGLRRVYGLEFEAFVPLADESQTRRALDDGVVDVGVMFTTDGTLATQRYIVLADDRGLQPAENLVPVVSGRVLGRHGARLTAPLDAVSARLSTTALRFLNWRLTVAGREPAVEARAWLRRQGLISP